MGNLQKSQKNQDNDIFPGKYFFQQGWQSFEIIQKFTFSVIFKKTNIESGKVKISKWCMQKVKAAYINDLGDLKYVLGVIRAH